jgi:hypothetical protein
VVTPADGDDVDTRGRLASALDKLFERPAGGGAESQAEGDTTDPDSTAEGIPRPDLTGVVDETPAEPNWSVDDDRPAVERGAIGGDLRGGTVDAELNRAVEPDEVGDAVTEGPYVLPPIVPATPEPPGEADADVSVAAPAPSDRPAARRVVVTTTPTVGRGPTTVSLAPAVPSATAPIAPTAGATSWSDHMPTVTAAPPELRAAGRRPRVRRVTRVVRHVDPWSVFKVGLIFSLVAYFSCLTAGVLLWRVADSTGTIDNVERWFTQFGWETFELKGGEIFHNAWIIGLFGAVALTGALVLLATLFNLVSDIVGGVRVTVLEEEVVEQTVSSARRYVVRRPVGGATAATVAPNWSVDDEAEAPVAPEPPFAAPVTVAGEWSVDD